MIPNNKYELVVVLDPDLDESGQQAQLQRLIAVITQHGGTIQNQDLWGRRQLAYRIAKKEYGFYVVLQFDGDNTTVSDLDRQLKINESVLRHLIVRKDKYAPDRRTDRDDEDLASFIRPEGEFDADPDFTAN